MKTKFGIVAFHVLETSHAFIWDNIPCRTCNDVRVKRQRDEEAMFYFWRGTPGLPIVRTALSTCFSHNISTTRLFTAIPRRAPPRRTYSKMLTVPSRRFAFKINDPTSDHVGKLRELGQSGNVFYLVFGHESHLSGNPYIVGFVIFKQKYHRYEVVDILPAHRIDFAFTQDANHIAYAKKKGDYEEFDNTAIGYY